MQSILVKLPAAPVATLGRCHTTSATSFLALQATAGRVLAMETDVVCQLVDVGMVPGYVMHAKGVERDATWRKVPCERAASAC
jgi:hypothetical protein